MSGVREGPKGQSLRGLRGHYKNIGFQPKPTGKPQEHLGLGGMSSNLYFKRITGHCLEKSTQGHWPLWEERGHLEGWWENPGQNWRWSPWRWKEVVGIHTLHFTHGRYWVSTDYRPGIVPFSGDSEQKKLLPLSLGAVSWVGFMLWHRRWKIQLLCPRYVDQLQEQFSHCL